MILGVCLIITVTCLVLEQRAEATAASYSRLVSSDSSTDDSPPKEQTGEDGPSVRLDTRLDGASGDGIDELLSERPRNDGLRDWYESRSIEPDLPEFGPGDYITAVVEVVFALLIIS